MITVKLSPKQYALLKSIVDRELSDFYILSKKSKAMRVYYDILYQTKIALLLKKE